MKVGEVEKVAKDGERESPNEARKLKKHQSYPFATTIIQPNPLLHSLNES